MQFLKRLVPLKQQAFFLLLHSHFISKALVYWGAQTEMHYRLMFIHSPELDAVGGRAFGTKPERMG